MQGFLFEMSLYIAELWSRYICIGTAFVFLAKTVAAHTKNFQKLF
jgi:hypothetical protein